MSAFDRNPIEWENGWESISSAITKLKRIVEGLPETPFNVAEYMTHYTTIYKMCAQKSPHNYSQQLYENYKNQYEEYIHSTVLPNIRGKHDTFLLRELVNRWEKYKEMMKWMSHFFLYLRQHFIKLNSLPGLREVGLSCFRDLVYEELKVNIRETVIALIDQEREGEQVERALLKNVLNIFLELGTKQMNCYETDFEGSMLDDSAGYYSRKASKWIVEYSCPDYMIKAEESLEKERDRVSHYMCSSTWPKIEQIVQNELLVVHKNQLIEKEHSGYRA